MGSGGGGRTPFSPGGPRAGHGVLLPECSHLSRPHLRGQDSPERVVGPAVGRRWPLSELSVMFRAAVLTPTCFPSLWAPRVTVCVRESPRVESLPPGESQQRPTRLGRHSPDAELVSLTPPSSPVPRPAPAPPALCRWGGRVFWNPGGMESCRADPFFVWLHAARVMSLGPARVVPCSFSCPPVDFPPLVLWTGVGGLVCRVRPLQEASANIH